VTVADRTVDDLEIEWPLASSLVRLSRYRCVVDSGTAREQRQPWHVIAFPHHGAYVHHGEDGSAVVDPSTVLFLNGGAPYRTSHPFGYGDHGSALVVRPDVLLDAVAVHDPAVRDRTRPFLFPQAPCRPGVYLAQRLLARHGGAGADELAVTEAALDLAGAAIAAAFEARPAPRRRRPGPGRRRSSAERIEAVRHEIARRYDGPLPLAELAALAGLSIYHLCRTFRAQTGLTIRGYRNRLRLRAALERLAEPRVDLTTLALDLGFSSHSHFTAAFREEFGVPPSHLRPRPRAMRNPVIAPPAGG
jgi:AraC-like DNA-binding protein